MTTTQPAIVDQKPLVRVDDKTLDQLEQLATDAQHLHTMENGLRKTMKIAYAVAELKAAIMQPNIMNALMQLQGRRIGFLTDLDKEGGYGPEVVADVTVEAIMRGAYMTGNETNIIAAGESHRKAALPVAPTPLPDRRGLCFGGTPIGYSDVAANTEPLSTGVIDHGSIES